MSVLNPFARELLIVPVSFLLLDPGADLDTLFCENEAHELTQW